MKLPTPGEIFNASPCSMRRLADSEWPSVADNYVRGAQSAYEAVERMLVERRAYLVAIRDKHPDWDHLQPQVQVFDDIIAAIRAGKVTLTVGGE